MREIDTECFGSLKDHPGRGFAAVAAAAVFGDGSVRVVRTKTDVRQGCSRLFKDILHPARKPPEIHLGVVAAADAGLVGDHHQKPARSVKGFSGFKHAVHKPEVFDPGAVGGVDVDDTVSV